MQTFIQSRTPKPMHIQMRKDARTAIYRAVFGQQESHSLHDHRENQPWLDRNRTRPQDWTAQSAWGTFESYKDEAKLSREALIEIASVLKVDLSQVL